MHVCVHCHIPQIGLQHTLYKILYISGVQGYHVSKTQIEIELMP